MEALWNADSFRNEILISHQGSYFLCYQAIKVFGKSTSNDVRVVPLFLRPSGLAISFTYVSVNYHRFPTTRTFLQSDNCTSVGGLQAR